MKTESLKTYAAKFYAHRSRVRKQVKLSGSCLSTIYGFGSTQLSETLMSYRSNCHGPKFLLSFYQSSKTKYMWLRRNQTKYESCRVCSLKRRTTSPHGLVISVSG